MKAIKSFLYCQHDLSVISRVNLLNCRNDAQWRFKDKLSINTRVGSLSQSEQSTQTASRRRGLEFSARRFVPSDLPLKGYIEKQSNKITLSETNRYFACFKEFLRTKEIDKEIENFGAKEHVEVLCAFIVKVSGGLEYFAVMQTYDFEKDNTDMFNFRCAYNYISQTR